MGTEYEAIVAEATAQIRYAYRPIDILVGRVCAFFCEVPDRLADRARTPKLIVVDPARNGRDFEHRLIIPYGTDSWEASLIRVEPKRPNSREVVLRTRLTVHLDVLDKIEVHPRYKSFAADVDRFVVIVERFLADPDAVFALSGANCVFCGRALTDEASRLRGIGPDCFEEYGDLMKYLRPTHPVA